MRGTTGLMRAALWLGAVLSAVSAVQLWVLTSETERYFAWTIAAPLSACFLGPFQGLISRGVANRRRVTACRRSRHV